MKCAVAIVLGFIAMSLAYPSPSGFSGLASPLLLPAVEARSSFINHGVTIPRIPVIIPAPIIVEPVVKVPIIKSLYSGYGYGH